MAVPTSVGYRGHLGQPADRSEFGHDLVLARELGFELLDFEDVGVPETWQ
jgi:hypothetical protein